MKPCYCRCLNYFVIIVTGQPLNLPPAQGKELFSITSPAAVQLELSESTQLY